MLGKRNVYENSIISQTRRISFLCIEIVVIMTESEKKNLNTDLKKERTAIVANDENVFIFYC